MIRRMMENATRGKMINWEDRPRSNHRKSPPFVPDGTDHSSNKVPPKHIILLKTINPV